MKSLAFLFPLLAALALLPVQAAEPLVIKFSHALSPATPKGKAADKFKELAERYSDGAVKVEVHPNGQLYQDREEMTALRLGAVQMLAPSFAQFGPLGLREFEVFDLPYIFPNKATLHRVMDGDIGTRLMARLEAKGIKGLAYWDNGFKQMSANRPLIRVEDFKGLKLRIQSSRVIDAQMRTLGGMPQVIPLSEVRTRLTEGAVDGTENTLSNFHSQKLYEVQKHLTLSDHGYLGYAVIVNKAFWEGLKPDLRAQLEKAMKEATVYERRIAQEENDAALEQIRAAGAIQIHVLSNEERRIWQQTLLPVHEQFADVLGRDTIHAIYRIAAEVAREQKPRSGKRQ
ncbi:TRAP transporter substrate-binding protein [Betaproteobacteria bacterium SCN2]|jgi:C4-dicarboxylate-binding protein DctP|nr:TRAP transporter substrate-binding protein [Betaproteobacteria bacterium SCN2]